MAEPGQLLGDLPQRSLPTCFGRAPAQSPRLLHHFRSQLRVSPAALDLPAGGTQQVKVEDAQLDLFPAAPRVTPQIPTGRPSPSRANLHHRPLATASRRSRSSASRHCALGAMVPTCIRLAAGVPKIPAARQPRPVYSLDRAGFLTADRWPAEAPVAIDRLKPVTTLP